MYNEYNKLRDYFILILIITVFVLSVKLYFLEKIQVLHYKYIQMNDLRIAGIQNEQRILAKQRLKIIYTRDPKYVIEIIKSKIKDGSLDVDIGEVIIKEMEMK